MVALLQLPVVALVERDQIGGVVDAAAFVMCYEAHHQLVLRLMGGFIFLLVIIHFHVVEKANGLEAVARKLSQINAIVRPVEEDEVVGL